MFRSARKLLHLGIVLLCLSGCRKEYTCSYSYYYNPAYVAFAGFAATELELVIVQHYSGDGNFTTLLSTDTLDASVGIVEGDTTYNSDNYGFFTVKEGVDFKILIPGTGSEFRITDVRRFEAGASWVQDEHCAFGAGQASIRSYGFKVNGAEYPPFQRKVNNWYIYLAKP